MTRLRPACYARDREYLYSQADFPRVEYVAGVENPTETLLNIVRWVVKHG